MEKIYLVLIFGIIAGLIDITPMLIMKLPWNANLAAFLTWVIAAFFIATSNIALNSIAKGVLVSFLLVLPVLPIINGGFTQRIPIIIMTLILGSLLGYFIGRI
ncbi:hypothetical protein A3J90_06000 [candidate division WOR-1 bacterium RIFOXYC2_FULL_37_10]|uniref:Uncharacterized protein n=1 Tax=candidate division WOR-1 bacterium RIFOXYB2_FULL_37_13 TaxID=1802579 RepID=A0A1F4SYC1_UNCSA|nr:MAG: hypothetical protein A2310_04645 [candidate division WOR-1 bacterium RIFOXYB2_FULL_37_13]OGC34787.1 MAG: hypothetical protein A3J90_06000 [candidate division WOR-1 bacterium RIFOXYC2_FULL_37_10]